MASPQIFPIVLLVTTFIVVAGAIIIAIVLESGGLRHRYRLRRGTPVQELSLAGRAAALWMKQRKFLLRPQGSLRLKS